MRRRLETELATLRSQASDTARLQAELTTETNERKRLQSELEFAKQQADNYATQLTQERGSLRGEAERTRAEHMRMVEETRQRLEDERKMHANMLDEEKNRLLDKERNAGILEGKVHTLSSEAEMLRAKVSELQQQAREAESQKARLTEELETERKDKVSSTSKLKEQVDDYEKKLEQADKGKQKKCCVMM